jgi:hypothetical protein
LLSVHNSYRLLIRILSGLRLFAGSSGIVFPI